MGTFPSSLTFWGSGFTSQIIPTNSVNDCVVVSLQEAGQQTVAGELRFICDVAVSVKLLHMHIWDWRNSYKVKLIIRRSDKSFLEVFS